MINVVPKYMLMSGLLFLILSCGPRRATLSQNLLGEWKIVDVTMNEKLPGDQEFYDRGIIYKFHTDHQYDIFLKNSQKVSGIWDAEDSPTNLGLNALGQKMNVEVDIQGSKMVWQMGDTTNIASPISTITFFKP